MSKIKCKHCRGLVDKDTAYRTSMQSFCNVEHYKAYFNSKPKPTPKVTSEWTKSRKMVVKLDGGACRVCGTRDNLHVHHIRYRGQPGGTDEVDNLITLCLEHHALVHTDKKLYQPRLFELVKKRVMGDRISRLKIGE